MHNIAIVQLRDGKLDEALDAIEEAVRIRKLSFGDDSPKLADSLNELGIIRLETLKGIEDNPPPKLITAYEKLKEEVKKSDSN
jgi:hypothetical protein